MPIEIVRVRPDLGRPAGKNSLAGGVIVEAVVPKDLLLKIKAMGFEASEVPQNDKRAISSNCIAEREIKV